MANEKISESPRLTAAQLADTDLVPMVDVSDTSESTTGRNAATTVAAIKTVAADQVNPTLLSTLTTSGDILTRGASAPARVTRADLAADAAFSSRFGPLPTGTPTVGQVPVVTTASPLALAWGSAGGQLRGVNFTGATGNFWSTPIAPVGASCTVLDVYARVSANDWTPTGNQYIIGCGISAAPNTSFGLSLRAGGALGLLVSVDGTATSLVPSIANPSVTDGQMIWVWARVETNSGGSMVYTYRQAPDSVELPAVGAFTLVGTPVPTTTIAQVFSSSAAVEIGSIQSGAGANFTGNIARVIVDANGVRRMDWRGDVNGTPRFVDVANVTWSPTGSAWAYRVGNT